MIKPPAIKSLAEIKAQNPPPKLKITPEQLEVVKKEYAGEQLNPTKIDKRKIFKWPFKQKSAMKKVAKKPDEITVFLLNSKRQIEVIGTKLYSGNFLVIRHRVYSFDPSRVFTMAKYKVIVLRDYDRMPVGVDDYAELQLRDFTSNNPGGRFNVDDPVLIKAIIQAHLSEKPTALKGNKIWIVVVVVIAIIIGFLWMSNSAKAPVVAK